MTGTARQPTGRYGGKTAEVRRAERRQRFLDAALELFGTGAGYRGASVAALCTAAGLSTRQFYEEYRNLEEMLVKLYLQVDTDSEQAAVEAIVGVGDQPPEQRATAALRAYAAASTADVRRVRIAFVESVGVSPELERLRLERRVRWAELICAEAEAAAKRGEAADRDYRLAANAYIGAVNGLLRDWGAGRVDATLDEVADELVLILMGILRPPGWRAPA